jgi:hypothetical protein
VHVAANPLDYFVSANVAAKIEQLKGHISGAFLLGRKVLGVDTGINLNISRRLDRG